jgi:protein SCO1/2
MFSNMSEPHEGAKVVKSRRSFFAPVVLLCGYLVLLPGCAKTSTSETQPPAVAAKSDRRPLTGEILRVDAEHKLLVVQHDEIKGYMPAMTMEFVVSAGDIAVAKPGQKIRAEMVTGKAGEIRLEKIWPNDKAETETVAALAKQLRLDTNTRGKSAYREVGETVPDFALYDQTGAVVQSGRFRGKQLMINFIYTRCPIATMCPAATAKMVTVQKLARDAGVSNLELISITMEPAYDTPGVLKEYATTHGIDTANFSLLTGPAGAIKDLLTQFGVIAEFEGDIIKHTLTTLLIDENGKIIHRADGGSWEPREFVAKMKRT